MRRTTTLLALLFAPALVLAQAPSASAPQAVFRSGVELVRLDVRVIDQDGRPVKDLRADEVEVTEAGARRPLLLFQHIAEPSGTYLEVARRTIGAEVSTNQGAPRGHLYVLVFDEGHIATGNEQRARTAAERFLRARFRPGDRVALYALPGPGPRIEFTSNVEQVIAALVRVRGTYDRSRSGNAQAMTAFEAYSILRGDLTVLDQVAVRSVGTATDSDVKLAGNSLETQRLRTPTLPLPDLERIAKANAGTVAAREDADARQFLLSLSDIVRTLATIEGRKTVAVFSEGFYADNVVYDVERVAVAAAQAYAVVYAFDLNRRGVDVASDEPLGASAQADVQNRLEPLGTMATDTDGRLVLDATAHLDDALKQMGDDTQDYYILGFEPAAAARSDRDAYRRVTVKVSRPGTTVHTRTGYSLRDPHAGLDKHAAVDAVLGAPFPQQGFPLELTTYVLHGEAVGIQRVVLSLSAELPVRSGEAVRADVVFAAKSARDGRIVASGTDTMPLPAAPRAGATTGIGRYTVQFHAPPGEYLMRVVVREPGGILASVDRRFEVAELDNVDLAASDLIVGSQTGSLPTRAALAVDQGLTAALEIYARRAGDLDRVEVVAELGRIGEETPVTTIKADLLDVKTLPGGASRAAQIDLPLTGVAPGQYALRAVVKAGGETVAERTRDVEILPAGTRLERPLSQPERARPVTILAGEVGRRFISALGETTADRAVAEATNYGLRGDWPRAETALRGAPGVYAVHALRGLALFASERFDESTTELNAALVLESSAQDAKLRAMGSFLRGWVHEYAGQDLDAITAWRNAILLDPTLVPAYLALADGYIRQSQPALATQVVRSGLAVIPKSIELQNKLKELESPR